MLKLLDLVDLPGTGATFSGERAWRFGGDEDSSAPARRAREAGSIAAVRHFKVDHPQRFLWNQIVPYGSISDARAEVFTVINTTVRNPFSRMEYGEQVEVPDFHIAGVVDVVAYEMSFNWSKGPGVCRTVIGAVDEILFYMNFTQIGDPWPWDQVTSITATQVSKITSLPPS